MDLVTIEMMKAVIVFMTMGVMIRRWKIKGLKASISDLAKFMSGKKDGRDKLVEQYRPQ